LALSVPLSRSTLRVGGGSAFFVRHHSRMIRIITFLGFALLAVGCSSGSGKYEPVVTDIQSGALVIHTNGAVRLSGKFDGLTPDDQIFVEKKPDGSLFVLFPTWYGRGNDLDGVLYCSRDLLPSDYYTIAWGSGGKQQHIDVGGRDMLTVHDYKPHWYKVSRRLD